MAALIGRAGVGDESFPEVPAAPSTEPAAPLLGEDQILESSGEAALEFVTRLAVSRKARDFWVSGARDASPNIIWSTKDDF